MPQLDFDGANSKISADKIQGQSGTTVTIPAGHNLAGDGSGLTSLPAANLTGTLPAIDGSNLTGVSGGKVQQIVSTMVVSFTSGSTTTPIDDSIPQNDEGNEFMTLAITPTSTTTKLKIDVRVQITNGNANVHMITALFQDTTADALASAALGINDAEIINIFL